MRLECKKKSCRHGGRRCRGREKRGKRKTLVSGYGKKVKSDYEQERISK